MKRFFVIFISLCLLFSTIMLSSDIHMEAATDTSESMQYGDEPVEPFGGDTERDGFDSQEPVEATQTPYDDGSTYEQPEDESDYESDLYPEPEPGPGPDDGVNTDPKLSPDPKPDTDINTDTDQNQDIDSGKDTDNEAIKDIDFEPEVPLAPWPDGGLEPMPGGEMDEWGMMAGLDAGFDMISAMALDDPTGLDIAATIDLSELTVGTPDYYIIGGTPTRYSTWSNQNGRVPMNPSLVAFQLYFDQSANGKTYKIVQSGVLAASSSAPKNGTTAFSQIIIGNNVNVTLILEDIDLGSSGTGISTLSNICIYQGANLTLLLRSDNQYTTSAAGSYVRGSIRLRSSNSTLTIDSGTVAGSPEGTLIVSACDPQYAAIGGHSTYVDSGTININGGTVNASNTLSNATGAAIGGSGAGSSLGNIAGSGTVNIRGGVVIATNTGSGAAIGGGGTQNNDAGYQRGGGNGIVAITGGTVVATAENGAAIGGGGAVGSGPFNSQMLSGGCTVSIEYATVTATSKRGAAIGGGATSINIGINNRTITIRSSANVKAYAGGNDDTSVTIFTIYARPAAIDANAIGSGSGYFVNARFAAPVSNSSVTVLQARDPVSGVGRNTLNLPAGYRLFAYNTGVSRTDHIQASVSGEGYIGDVVRDEAGNSPDIYSVIGTSVLPVKTTQAVINPNLRYQVYDQNNTLVDSRDSLGEAVGLCANNVDYTIVITSNDPDMTFKGNASPNYSTDQLITIPASKKITLRSNVTNPSQAHTITMKGGNKHFLVLGTLTLERVILDGNGTGGGVIVGVYTSETNYTRGNLFLRSGAVIQHCAGLKLYDSYFGGGVEIRCGTVEMFNESFIRNNTANTNTSGTTGHSAGGGVYVNGSLSTLTMYGGTISDNIGSTSTTVYSNNYVFGGGVFVDDCGLFNLEGGTICRNIGSTVRAAEGGGVYIYGSGLMNMSGGTISNNIASTASDGSGGGIGVGIGGSVTISGGTITGNAASTATGAVGTGGGVSLRTESALLISGNTEIRANTANTRGPGNGGGIFADTYSGFGVIGNVKIIGNSALRNGSTSTAYGHGGGIYTTTGSNEASPPVNTTYTNIIYILSTVTVSGNIASITSIPPNNALQFNTRFPGTLLDNNNINYLHPNNPQNGYSILYIANNGTLDSYVQPSGNQSTATVMSGTAIGFTSPEPALDFSHWTTNPDGTGTRYDPGQTVTFNAAGSIILYAQWGSVNPTVTISETVTGDFADRLKVFNFTALFSNDSLGYSLLTSPTSFQCTITDSEGTNNVTLNLVNGTLSFGLKHGQSIAIKNVPKDCWMTITEADTDIYKVSFIDSEVSTEEVQFTTGARRITGNRTFQFTNERLSIVPVGTEIGDTFAMIPLLAMSLLPAISIPISKAGFRRGKRSKLI